MRRRRKVCRLVLAPGLLLTSWLQEPLRADDAPLPHPVTIVDLPPSPPPPPATLVKQPPSVQPPPSSQPPPSAAPPSNDQLSSAAPPSDAGAAAPAPFTPSVSAAALGAAIGGRADTVTVSPVAASVSLAGGSAAPVLNAPDLGEILSKSPSAAGVDVQRRNAVSSDPRIRGFRTGDFDTIGDGALFFPARQDLDTAIAKFDPGSVRDIVIVKGPYSALYGPGFAFLDIATLDSPRYDCFQAHGRTSVGFQTNGGQWDELQSVFAGDKEWGFRMTANQLNGNDYLDGNGNPISASYGSTNVNYAVGVNLTNDSKLEFKGLYVHQQNLEFPGLYFDIKNLDTESYNLRYTLVNQPYFDAFTMTGWYNHTQADGNTQQGAKQAFVQQLLNVSFNFPNFPIGVIFPAPPALVGPQLFQDFSTTNFSNSSAGYRAAMVWGESGKPMLTVGNDLTVLGQHLEENIRILQTAGPPVATSNMPSTVPQLLTQNQSIPSSTSTDPGLFAELELPVNDRLKIKAGGRVDFVHTDSDPRLITGNVNLFGSPTVVPPTGPLNEFVVDPIVYSSNPTDNSLSRQFNLFMGFLTSEYKLDEHLTAIAAGGYAERAPTLTELYASGPFIGVLQQGTSRLIGDPNLQKPRNSQFDIGLKADYDWFKGGVTGFYADIDNYITFDANKLGPGLTQVVFTNTNRATLAGGEAFGIVEATSWLSPFINLGYVQGIDQTHIDNRRSPNLFSSRAYNPAAGEFATATEPLPQIPPLDMRAGFRIHNPLAKSTDNPKWTVECSAHIVMGQNEVASSLGELPTAGYTVFDIRSFWQVNDKLLVSGGVENLGDQNYRNHLDPISGNMLSVDPLFRPGTNFYFAAQLTY